MKAEKAIRKAIELNPLMCPNRTMALELLFGLLGGGLDWCDGEVKDIAKDNYLNRKEPHWYNPRDRLMEKVWQKTFMDGDTNLDILGNTRENMYNWWQQISYFHNTKMQEVLDDIDNRCQLVEIPDRLYPLCDLSVLLNIPDNVKSDWLDIAEEYCQIVLKTDPNYIDKNRYSEKTNKENHKWAKKALRQIKKLRKNR